MSELTLGSLFDGSGGFPLGGLLSGITPVWASEIEPFPIRVTTKRLPQMKHYGDVSLMDGSTVEPVDIITFGSPCQDMSIAGSREGLDGSRSGLFYEAVRVVKEMRCATNGRYPKYIVWENVQGAFSSNKGEDFRCVLESICRICDETVSVPQADRWRHAGSIVGDGYSVAWRLLDAQYWGVPQRRKRIYLVADLTGGCAAKILFESEGLSGYSAEGFRAWQRSAADAGESTHKTGGTFCLNDQGGERMEITLDVVNTLRAEAHHPPVVAAGFCTEHSSKSRSIGFEEETSPTLRAGTVPAAVYENHSQASRYTGPLDVAPTVMSRYGTGGNNQPFVVETEHYSASKNSFFMDAKREQANTLVATDYKDPPLVNDTDGTDCIVRRLTPVECARLQGFPDWWCSGLETEKPSDEEMYFWYKVFETWRQAVNPEGKPKTSKQIRRWLENPHTDSAEYKLWGNGVALPCVVFVLSGIAYYAETEQKDVRI